MVLLYDFSTLTAMYGLEVGTLTCLTVASIYLLSRSLVQKSSQYSLGFE